MGPGHPVASLGVLEQMEGKAMQQVPPLSTGSTHLKGVMGDVSCPGVLQGHL